MADNVAITPGSGATAAADDIGGVLHQRIKLTLGSDGVSDGDVSSTNPIPVRFDQGPQAIISSNGSLQVDATQVNEHSAESLNAPNATLRGDEPVQMVGLHPSYPLPIDTATPMPIAGRDSTGAQRQLLVSDTGALNVNVGTQNGVMYTARVTVPGSTTTTVTQFPCQDYQSVAVHVFLSSGGSNGSLFAEFSNDLVNWYGALGYDVARGGFQSGWGANNATGAFVYPVCGLYCRLRYTANSPTQTIGLTAHLRNAPVSTAISNLGPIANGSTVNGVSVSIGQIANVAVSPASAQLGVNAFGPIAAGSAHGANNPVQISGSDGTNVRRILTDTSGNTQVVGGIAVNGSLIPSTSALSPVLVGASDLERRAQRMVVDGLGRLRIQNEESASKDDGIVDALNNIVRELKLMNAKLTDLPYYLGINAVMPDDGNAFRDDPTLFNQ